MIRQALPLALLLAGTAGAQQLALPPETAGNVFECFNTDGDGASCNHQRSGSWITGDSDGVNDVVLTVSGGALRRSTGLGFATFCLREYATAKRHIHANVI